LCHHLITSPQALSLFLSYTLSSGALPSSFVI
jgi:hypothetical protein